LLQSNEKLEMVCDLCKEFSFSADNKTVTFKLRENVKWHDGQPFTAKDVAFTFRSMLDPDYTGVRTNDYAALAGVQKMLDQRDQLDAQVSSKQIDDATAAKQKKEAWEAWLKGDGQKAIHVIDDYTISFTTDEPYAPLLINLAFPIIPEHIFKNVDLAKMEDADATHNPIGTGPYKFVEFKDGQYVKLERNENYYMGKPHIPTIVYKVVNQDVAIGQLKAGELDFIEMQPKDVDLVKGDKNIRVEERADFGYQYMGFNTDREFFKDKRVRQAIMYAINRQGIVDQLLGGHGTVMNSHMPPALWAYDASQLNSYPYDPNKAKQLLADAGWKPGPDGILTKDGKPFEFTLKYPTGNKVREQSAPLIQANLKEVGIKVNLQQMEFQTLSTTVFDQRNMDAWLMGWSLSLDPDPGSIFLPTNSWGKVTGWTNATSEQLIKNGTKVLKVEERKPIYVQWAKILNDELPYAFLYSQNKIDAMRQDRIKGLKPDARGSLWNIWELWIPKDEQ